MSQARAREAICGVGASLFARGYVHATAGNISVRLDDESGGYLVTPTDACLGFLDPARLAHVDADGRPIAGDPPSKTIALHLRIYAAARRFDANTSCVIHTHSTHCVALTLRARTAELLPPITPYFVMKVGHVPMIPYRRPGDPEVADLVLAHAARVRAVVMERLGPLVWHDTVSAACFALEELEETAKLWLMLRNAPPSALSEARIDEIRRAFNIAY